MTMFALSKNKLLECYSISWNCK